jgi:hypothetical protein
MASRYRYDYYRVDVPEDVGTMKERCSVAIETARERATLYVVPCAWEVLTIAGERFTVRRKRFARRGGAR